MSWIFFKREDAANDHPDVQVSDLNPLPIEVYWRAEEETDPEQTNAGNAFPVQVVGRSPVRGKTSQVSVATTATLIAVYNPKRSAIMITNVTGTQVVYIGFNGAVSTSTGDYLHSAAGSSKTTYAREAIYGIAVTSAQTVTVLEEEFLD